jgi:hypothetical protein
MRFEGFEGFDEERGAHHETPRLAGNVAVVCHRGDIFGSHLCALGGAL